MKALHQVPIASALDLALVASDLTAVTVPLHILPTAASTMPGLKLLRRKITFFSSPLLLIYSLK